MISDKTIEEKTAKYWCIFADEKLKNALDKVISNITNAKEQKIAQKIVSNEIISNSKKLNEGFIDFMSKFTPTDPTGGSVGIVSDLVGKSQNEINANAVAMASAAGIAATTLTSAGRSIASTIGQAAVKNPGATAVTLAAGKLAMDAAGDENDAWWEKLGKLVNKVWDIGKFTADHAKEIAIASTTAYALFKTAGIWMPLVASMVKSFLRGKSLAIVEFDSNGVWYKMHYDIKYKRWELLYKGFSFGNSPQPEETEQLMNTKFFKAYVAQCKRYIELIVNNENREAVLQAIGQLSDNATKNILDVLLSDNDIIDNMFALKFKY